MLTLSLLQATYALTTCVTCAVHPTITRSGGAGGFCHTNSRRRMFTNQTTDSLRGISLPTSAHLLDPTQPGQQPLQFVCNYSPPTLYRCTLTLPQILLSSSERNYHKQALLLVLPNIGPALTQLYRTSWITFLTEATRVNPIHPIRNSLKKQKPCTKVDHPVSKPKLWAFSGLMWVLQGV